MELMWVSRNGVRHWVGPRPVEPYEGSDPVALLDADDTFHAIDAIVGQIKADHHTARTAWERASGREVCSACGCLCLPDEVCPGCLSRDVDDVAVRRRLSGDKSVPLSPDEQDEAYRRWQASGRAGKDFERHTGINAGRVRKRIGEVA